MWQRVTQFREAGAQPTERELAFARERLSQEAFELFRSQHPRDIVHSTNTARWLVARGYDNADLLAAALLHDVGKGHQRRLDRVAYVVSEWLKSEDRAGSHGSRLEMRRAMARSRDHSEAGARMARDAGVSERIIELILNHHAEADGDAMLALLQQADAAN